MKKVNDVPCFWRQRNTVARFGCRFSFDRRQQWWWWCVLLCVGLFKAVQSMLLTEWHGCMVGWLLPYTPTPTAVAAENERVRTTPTPPIQTRHRHGEDEKCVYELYVPVCTVAHIQNNSLCEAHAFLLAQNYKNHHFCNCCCASVRVHVRARVCVWPRLLYSKTPARLPVLSHGCNAPTAVIHN